VLQAGGDSLELMNKLLLKAMKPKTTKDQGTFIFRLRNSRDIESDIRVSREAFEALPSAVSRVLYIHALHRDITQGLPFSILSRRWEQSFPQTTKTK